MTRNNRTAVGVLVAYCAVAGTFAFVSNKLNRRPFFHALSMSKEDELFDPLLSPHAYPNGIDAGPAHEVKKVPFTRNKETKKRFGFRTNDEVEERTYEAPSTTTTTTPTDLDFFDPLISPHAYTKGTPDKVGINNVTPQSLTVDETPTRKLGILLMDHGSRNPASNERLHELARLYQSTFPASSKVVVRAAHMEIAEPSIPQVLRELVVDDGVDEVVCHPYFLSPGRHVKEDIPQIVGDAVASIREEHEAAEEVNVTTTAPVGSNTDIMVKAIHNLVQQSTTIPL